MNSTRIITFLKASKYLKDLSQVQKGLKKKKKKREFRIFSFWHIHMITTPETQPEHSDKRKEHALNILKHVLDLAI